MDIEKDLRTKAEDLGLPLLGVADPDEFDAHPRVQKTSISDEHRPRPREVWEGCRSVLVVGFHCPEEAADALLRVGGSRCIFYSEIINHRLYRIREWLTERGWETRPAPEISHKRAALLAGLGHMGRNALVAHPTYGSNLRFGVLLTDADLSPAEPTDPFTDELCGDCRRCEQICPTAAIADYRVDFSRCVVPAAEGWLDEVQERIEWARKVQRRGEHLEVECNLCQKVCPLNSTG